MEYNIEFYKGKGGGKPVLKFLDKLGRKNSYLRNRVSAGINKLKYEENHRLPLWKPLKNGLFEVRVDFVRIICCFSPGQRIILLHPVKKKRGDISKKDLKIAKRNYQDYMIRNRRKDEQN